MGTLRLTQFAVSDDRYRVEVAVEGDGLTRQLATAEFKPSFTAQDQEDLRWYLEDYLEHAADPAPKIAARVERRMAEMGTDLFKALFHANDDARDLWASLRDRLNETRVEIVTGVREATALPWELLRDPKTDTPLALRANAFVRAVHQAAQRPRLPQTADGPIRILLVICRPGGGDDVPFRSVASRLIKGLGENASEMFDLELLRPPTFEHLAEVLRASKAEKNPYHVVHFDGHGIYANVGEPGVMATVTTGFSSLVFSPPHAGTHGYLKFENPAVKENVQLVDGTALGKLLAETEVPVLILNACRSAHSESPAEPENAASEQAVSQNADAVMGSDIHRRIRAFGSLAQEVMDAGVAGVVAMRYNVYVVTAAQFVADIYGALRRGQVLGEAVTLGRQHLHDAPLREITFEQRPLQDWAVPVVYEAAPIRLFPRTAKPANGLHINVTAGQTASAKGGLELGLPPEPDAGFFGRDETLLSLDRAFDSQSIVLLHGSAGSGKTATAAEFARWYRLTGGFKGPLLFASFDRHKPLKRVLDTIGQVFGDALEQVGVRWLTLSDEQRRDVALQVAAQRPLVWIWDNIEPIAGFPPGTPSTWSEVEQNELADFLRAARRTRARFVLTSRRDELGWLGDLPARVAVPPMPMRERVQLARALAEKYGRRLTEVDDWHPLLQFTQGNPLTITVLVGQALRDGIKTKTQMEAFVARLRAGEAVFEDEPSEGRSKSLGASLSYGFEHAFSDSERKQLALMHLFQGFVDANALVWMGDPKYGWCLPEVHALTHEAAIALLDRCAEAGLLTARGNGRYIIHAALPWFFKGLFETYYPTLQNPQSPTEGRSESNQQCAAECAFANAMAELATMHVDEYVHGQRKVMAALSEEEANLLNSRRLARSHGWWSAMMKTTQGLRFLYNSTGRHAAWVELVNEIVPDFIDPATDGPLPGREEHWSFVTEYRVGLAREAGQWAEAERLQGIRMNWERQRAASALAVPPATLDKEQRNAIRMLALSVEQWGDILLKKNDPGCVAVYEEAGSLLERIGDKAAAAHTYGSLGDAYYKNIPDHHDLSKAETYYWLSLGLYGKSDHTGMSICYRQLGDVYRTRFLNARAAKPPAEEEFLPNIEKSLFYYQLAANLTPADNPALLAQNHTKLGTTYGDAGDIKKALSHYQEGIRYYEEADDLLGAARTRFNTAVDLVNAGRLTDAIDYARAARDNFEAYGEGAAEMKKRAQSLVAEIEQSVPTQGG